MRVIEEISYPQFKLSVFYMNGKYIINFSQGNLEQAFKISELDYIIKDVHDIKQIVNDEFIRIVLARFTEMNKQLATALIDF